MGKELILYILTFFLAIATFGCVSTRKTANTNLYNISIDFSGDDGKPLHKLEVLAEINYPFNVKSWDSSSNLFEVSGVLKLDGGETVDFDNSKIICPSFKQEFTSLQLKLGQMRGMGWVASIVHPEFDITVTKY